MPDDSAIARAVDTVLPRRLHELQAATGLPVLFAGTTSPDGHAQQLTIDHLIGTLGDSLRQVSVLSGRGLGGAAMVRRTACRVSDYATTTSITHHYDHVVVEHERLTSLLACPVVVHGAVRGVVYGALRESRPIGDVAVRNAGVVAANIARDAAALLKWQAPPGRPATGDPRDAAIDELADLIDRTTDPELRYRLSRIHHGLTEPDPEGSRLEGRGGAPRAATGDAAGPALSPREVETLRHVAVGATNAEIAAHLGITVGTVKAYLHSAMRKLQTRNRARAVIAAREAGLI